MSEGAFDPSGPGLRETCCCITSYAISKSFIGDSRNRSTNPHGSEPSDAEWMLLTTSRGRHCVPQNHALALERHLAALGSTRCDKHAEKGSKKPTGKLPVRAGLGREATGKLLLGPVEARIS